MSRRILEAAQAQFAEQGYAATSLRTIASAAGVTKPMVYYYFGSKEGLYRSLIDLAYDELRHSLEEAATSSGNARHKLEAVARVHMMYAGSRAATWHFLSACAGSGPAHGAPPLDLQRFRALETAALTRILAQGEREGSVRALDGEVFAAVFQGTMLSLAHRRAALDEHESSTLSERVVALLWEGIAKR